MQIIPFQAFQRLDAFFLELYLVNLGHFSLLGRHLHRSFYGREVAYRRVN